MLIKKIYRKLRNDLLLIIILCICTSFFLLVRRPKKSSRLITVKSTVKPKLKSVSNCCNFSNSIIECTDCNEKYLHEAINNLPQEVNGEIKLITKDIHFGNNSLPEKWLSEIKTQIIIKHLEITNCRFKNIPSKLFSQYPFTELHTLIVINSQIEILRKESFTGLINLSEFAFRSYQNRKLESIEAGIFSDASSLQILQLNGCLQNEKQLKNLTSNGNSLKALQILDLQSNFLESLSENAFSGVRKVLSIYLYNNQLSSIDVNTFKGVKVQQINLASNYLQYIPEGIFLHMSTIKRSVYLQGNPWKCDCNLIWLQEEYMKHNSIIITEGNEKPYCNDDGLTTFEEGDFTCDSTTESPESSTSRTETPESTTSRTETLEFSTSSPEENDSPIKCHHELKLSTRISKKSQATITDYDLRTEAESSEIILHFMGDLQNVDLLYFQELFDSQETECLTNLKSPLVLTNLHCDQIYTFCLVNRNETIAAIGSCTGVKTLPTWSDQTWIANENQILVISLIGVGFIIGIIIGVLIALVIVRKYPRFLKNVPFTPKTRCLETQFGGPQVPVVNHLPSTSNSGYMTPHFYEKVKYDPPSVARITIAPLPPIPSTSSEIIVNSCNI